MRRRAAFCAAWAAAARFRAPTVMCERPAPASAPSPQPATTPPTQMPPPPFAANKPRFCSHCAGALVERVPSGDERTRLVCDACRRVHYVNPKPVASTVALSADNKRVLLARRAIPPVGKWCIPGGFLEVGESVDAGAVREAWEECRAQLDGPRVLLAVYSILPASQVQLVYRTRVANEHSIAPGVESLETKMFAWNDIPWDHLAFTTVAWALKHALDTLHDDIPRTQLRSKLFDGSFVDAPM